MFCSKCGNPLNPEAKYCDKCGQMVSATTNVQNQNNSQIPGSQQITYGGASQEKTYDRTTRLDDSQKGPKSQMMTIALACLFPGGGHFYLNKPLRGGVYLGVSILCWFIAFYSLNSNETAGIAAFFAVIAVWFIQLLDSVMVWRHSY